MAIFLMGDPKHWTPLQMQKMPDGAYAYGRYVDGPEGRTFQTVSIEDMEPWERDCLAAAKEKVLGLLASFLRKPGAN